MENRIEKKPMPKWLIYGLFILKFLLGLYLIYWTVYMTLQSDVGKDDDKAFLSTYQDVDRDYSKIVRQNQYFNNKYDTTMVINDQIIKGVTQDDIYLSQRIVKTRKIRKNMLKVGNNKITIDIKDKNGNLIKDKTVKLLVTKNNTHQEDQNLLFKQNSSVDFIIKSKGYWNITGVVEIGEDKGYFYIKTNAK